MHIRRSAQEIAANRARYEDHQRIGLQFAPRALPGRSPRPAPAVEAGRVIAREVIPGGCYWWTKLRRHEVLRASLDSGFSTLTLVAWNAADPTERLNLPDTVKLQWTTGLGKGRVIFSDMGKVMVSIVEDSCGAHDCLMGGSTAATNRARYGEEALRNTRDNLVIVAAKLGLSTRDIPAALALFAPVRVDAAGRFLWQPDLLNGDDWVDLRAEMDLWVGLSNCPHPLDPDPLYAPNPVTVTRIAAAPPAVDDLCRTATAEAVRGFENNTFSEA